LVVVCVVLALLQVDEEEDPASIEHFGISTVEVMSSGVIPIGLARGGSPSIITHGVNGFLADNIDDYIKYTIQLFNMSTHRLQDMQNAARVTTERFSFSRFTKAFRDLCVNGVLSAGYRSFVNMNIGLLRKKRIVLPVNPRRVAVIVETGVKHEFEYAVRNVMMRLGPDWGLVVVHNKANAAFVHHVLKGVTNPRFYGLELDVSDSSSKDRLFKSAWFWRMLQADKALIFQSDSMMLRDSSLDDFMQYDYIGAPFPKSDQIWSSGYGKLIGEGVGSGAFSLRSVEAMIEICEKMGSESPANESEDVFFVVNMVRTGTYNLPSRQDAYRFVQEVPCPELRDTTPLAVHAKWYYNPLHRRQYHLRFSSSVSEAR